METKKKYGGKNGSTLSGDETRYSPLYRKSSFGATYPFNRQHRFGNLDSFLNRKTYAASYMAKFLDAFVAINTQEEREVSQVCQVQLESPDELQEALEEGYRRIEFTPSMDRDTAIEEVEVIREQLFEIGSEMKARSTELEIPFWITVFLDESQVYAPIMTHKDAESFFTRGRGYGIRGVAISRQPQELSKEIVNNVEYELIFKQGHYAELYFTRFKIPIEQHQEWINKEHHFLLYDKTSITRCLPVK